MSEGYEEVFLDIVKEEQKESSYLISNMSQKKIPPLDKFLHNDA